MFSITGNNALLCPCHCPLCRHPSSHHSEHIILLSPFATHCFFASTVIYICCRCPIILKPLTEEVRNRICLFVARCTPDTHPYTNIPLSPNLCQHEQDLWCYLNGNWVTLHLHLYILLSSVIIYKPTYKLLRMLPDLLIQFGTIKWYNLAF